MNLDTAFPELIRALPSADAAVPARMLKTPGCEVHFVAAPVGAEMPLHCHDTDNATVIISGDLTLITDTGETRLGPTEWYQTRPGQMHALRFGADTVLIELRLPATKPQT